MNYSYENVFVVRFQICSDSLERLCVVMGNTDYYVMAISERESKGKRNFYVVPNHRQIYQFILFQFLLCLSKAVVRTGKIHSL